MRVRPLLAIAAILLAIVLHNLLRQTAASHQLAACEQLKLRYELGDQEVRRQVGAAGGEIRQECGQIGVVIYGGGY